VSGRERTSAEFFSQLDSVGFVEPRVERLHAPRGAILARKP